MHTRGTITKTYWTALAFTLAVPGVTGVTGLNGSSASGQTGQLEVVAEGIEDVSPLAVSLRDARVSLRQPADFGRVYRLQDDSNRLFRAQGGLYAVFPRSVYAADKDGNVFAIVPPDTLYYIGPPSGLTASTELRADADRLDGHIESRVAPGLVSAVPRQPATEPSRHRSTTRFAASTVTPAASIILDPDYRARRLRSLMRVAANARRSFTPPEDRRPRRRSIPGIPASSPATPSGD